MAESPQRRLKVAGIYSFGANEDETDGILDEENPEDTSALEQVLKCGCSVLATVHGGSYEELSRKRFLQPLLQAGAFQRYLVLKHCDGSFFVEQVRDGDGQLLASGLACCGCSASG